MSGAQGESVQQGGDLHSRIREVVARLEHLLPGQAPLKDFVHHNTLHGYQHLPFDQALASARRLTGARGYMPREYYQSCYTAGRIDSEDLLASIDEADDLEPQTLIAEPAQGRLRRRDVYLAALLLPPSPVSGSQLNWLLEEQSARERLEPTLPADSRARLLAKGKAAGLDSEAAVTDDLWRACLEVLRLDPEPPHPEELFDLTPELAERMLQEMLAQSPERNATPEQVRQQMRNSTHDRLSEQLSRLGRGETLRDLLLSLTGRDLLDEIREPLIRSLAHFLDQGVGGRDAAQETRGFYAFWRRQAEQDPSWRLQSIDGWQQHLELLHNDPLDTLISELHRMGLPRERWSGYLERLALELPGWSGMVLWRHNHPGYAGLAARVDMLDYLAVRLVLERIHAHHLCAGQFGVEASLDMLRWYFRRHHEEYKVRQALFSGRLPEYLASRAQRAVNSPQQGPGGADPERWRHLAQSIWTWRHSGLARQEEQPGRCREAWPLFQLAQRLEIGGDELRRLTPAQITALFDCLAALDEDRAGYLWLQAYERHYRNQVLNALTQHRARANPPHPTPQAQLVFCMDDREEGLRRHIEELQPRVETFGTAAHYNVPHNWRGLDDPVAGPQAPVIPQPVIPAHEVREIPTPEAETRATRHRQWHSRLQWLGGTFLQRSRRGLLLPGVLSAIAAPAALLLLAGKVLLPGAFGRIGLALRSRLVTPVDTRIEFIAPHDSPEASPDSPRLGFTDREQADRVATLLVSLGLRDGFSPLVAIIGHGSRNRNNPHAAAYNCGACSGRFSGPNARLVAAMANRPAVRELLAQRDIRIPQDTHFIAAEHDTCNDAIEWYDLGDLPPALAPDLERLRELLSRAAQRHARERCRRFASAPAQPDPRKALAHVAGRGLDFSQARPELGHATNACAIFGRRAASRGVFFDRRAFLVSYDPAQDPQGEVLERHLLTNGAVGAGISLEYYFSRVDNEVHGCGTKVTHNITGYFGVMEGAGSDLRTGLPRQMIEIHEAMRLLVVVEAKRETLERILQRQPPLRELIDNAWIQLVAMDPADGRMARFLPGRGWVPWQAAATALPRVACSADWYLGRDGALPPALLETRVEESVHG